MAHSTVRVIYNRLLGGWYIVRGPHQTPLAGKFSSKQEAQAALAAKRYKPDAQMIDLSTPEGLQQYIDLFSTRDGRWLANRLGLAGVGSETLANNVSAFVWNARACNSCRTEKGEFIYAHACRICLENAMSSPLFSMLERRFTFPPLQYYLDLEYLYRLRPANK